MGPGTGFLMAVWFVVPHIDTIYNKLAERNKGEAKPEYRLPLANVGALAIPIALFCTLIPTRTVPLVFNITDIATRVCLVR